VVTVVETTMIRRSERNGWNNLIILQNYESVGSRMWDADW